MVDSAARPSIRATRAPLLSLATVRARGAARADGASARTLVEPTVLEPAIVAYSATIAPPTCLRRRPQHREGRQVSNQGEALCFDPVGTAPASRR